MLFPFGACMVYALITSVFAIRLIVVTVGGNTTDDPGKVFQPQSVKANQGDVIYFNFTLGNHTATQSLLDSPCRAAYISNYTVNSFDSGFRNAGNGFSWSDMLITILDPNIPIWFFDFNTCAQGGVGAINAKDSGSETLQNFQNNVMRINGTGLRPQSNSTSTQVGTSSSVPPVHTQTSDDPKRTIAMHVCAVLSLLIIAISL